LGQTLKLPNCTVLGGNGSPNYSFVSETSEFLHKKATFIKQLTLSLFHKGLVLFYTGREKNNFHLFAQEAQQDIASSVDISITTHLTMQATEYLPFS